MGNHIIASLINTTIDEENYELQKESITNVVSSIININGNELNTFELES